MEINGRNGKQVPSAHPSSTGDRDTGTENSTGWTMPPTKSLLGCREGLVPAEVLGCQSIRGQKWGAQRALPLGAPQEKT